MLIHENENNGSYNIDLQKCNREEGSGMEHHFGEIITTSQGIVDKLCGNRLPVFSYQQPRNLVVQKKVIH